MYKENKELYVKFCNFLNQTHAVTIKPMDHIDLSLLFELRYELKHAIEFLGAIDRMDWRPISTEDFLYRKQIRIDCINDGESYYFFLPNSVRMQRFLDKIINNMNVSKITDVCMKTECDEVDEHCLGCIHKMGSLSDNIPAPIRMPKAEKCIFNGPATIVFWSDGTKTVVKCQSEDDKVYSEEAGVALCFMKKALGNNGNYNNVLNELIKDGLGNWAENIIENIKKRR